MTCKYRKGTRLTFQQAINRIIARRMLFERDKLQNPAWAMSWQLSYIIFAARRGELFDALPVKENTQ